MKKCVSEKQIVSANVNEQLLFVAIQLFYGVFVIFLFIRYYCFFFFFTSKKQSEIKASKRPDYVTVTWIEQ